MSRYSDNNISPEAPCTVSQNNESRASLIKKVFVWPAIIIMGLLALGAATTTVYREVYAGKFFLYSVLGSNNLLMQLLLPLLIAIALIMLAVLISTRTDKLSISSVLLFTAIFSFALQSIWVAGIYSVGANGYHDTDVISRLAVKVIDGDYSPFLGMSDYFSRFDNGTMSDENWYMIAAPHQSGNLFLFVALFLAFGKNNFIAFQIVNSLANSLSIVFCSLIVRNLTRDDRACKYTAIMAAGFLPFLMSSTFVYSNSIAFCLILSSILLMLFGICHTRKTSYVYYLGSVLLAVVAVSLKQTLILVVISQSLALIALSLSKGQLRYFAIGALSLIIVFYGCRLPKMALESITDTELGSGWSTPSYVAMGLATDAADDSKVGYWNGDVSARYINAKGDQAIQNELAYLAIEESVREFLHNPLWFMEFFIKKISIEWLEPDYLTLWLARCGASLDLDSPLTKTTISGTLENSLIITALDGMQSALYFLAFIGLLCLARRNITSMLDLLFPAILNVGFIVYLLWEAQGVYTLPYSFLLLPFCSVAIIYLRSWVERNRKSAIHQRWKR